MAKQGRHRYNVSCQKNYTRRKNSAQFKSFNPAANQSTAHHKTRLSSQNTRWKIVTYCHRGRLFSTKTRWSCLKWWRRHAHRSVLVKTPACRTNERLSTARVKYFVNHARGECIQKVLTVVIFWSQLRKAIVWKQQQIVVSTVVQFGDKSHISLAQSALVHTTQSSLRVEWLHAKDKVDRSRRLVTIVGECRDHRDAAMVSQKRWWKRQYFIAWERCTGEYIDQQAGGVKLPQTVAWCVVGLRSPAAATWRWKGQYSDEEQADREMLHDRRLNEELSYCWLVTNNRHCFFIPIYPLFIHDSLWQ